MIDRHMQETMFYSRFGAAVRYWRKKRNLTQSSLAEALRLSRASIANIENGRQKILLYQFHQLCTLLRVNSAELLSPNELELGKESLKDVLDRVPEQHRKAVQAVLNPPSSE